MVVHGQTGEGGGMDELSVSGVSAVAEVRPGGVQMVALEPESAGLQRWPMEALAGAGAAENAAILRSVFAGEQGARRDVVVLNAAAVLVTAELAGDLRDGVRTAQKTIDRGAVTELVEALVRRV
jgi:anthranilate phosphoribosyltransferase